MRATLLGLAGWTAACVLAGPAMAGTYDVYGCRLPDGRPAPANGWTLYGHFGSSLNTCHARGSLQVQMHPSVTVPGGQQVGLAFVAPPHTTIESYSLYRAARIQDSGYQSRTYWLFHEAPIYPAPHEAFAQEVCTNGYMSCLEVGSFNGGVVPQNLFERRGLAISRIYVAIECWVQNSQPPPECPPFAEGGTAKVFLSRIRLADREPPTFDAPPRGSLLDPAAPVKGERAVTVAARDFGGGLARVAILVDGEPIQDQPLEPMSAACREPYTALVPCPTTGRATLLMNTTRVPNGVHQVTIALTDAAGNRTVSQPVRVTFRNGGTANGINANRFARIEAWFKTKSLRRPTSGTVSFGKTRRVVGRLLAPSGAPITGANLTVSTTARYPGARSRQLGMVQTDGKGRFRFRPPRGPSRTLRIDYRAFALDEAPAASADLALRVRAGVVLAIRPRRVGFGGRITFRGRLLGKPRRDGAQVALYAVPRRGRGEVPVAFLRADALGRFRYAYRLQRTNAPFT
jgi:hypothetical protein